MLQPKRLKSLREICQNQEGSLSPSYQVHTLFWQWQPHWETPPTPPNLLEHDLLKFEVEATDLIFPYSESIYGDDIVALELEYFLNDSRNDWLTFGELFANSIVKNFPFYKVVFQIKKWPEYKYQENFQIKFYTFTNPRVIQDLSK